MGWNQRPERACIELGGKEESPTAGRIWTPAITFEFDKATLRPESLGVLDGVVLLVLRYPEIRRLRVECHSGDPDLPPRGRVLTRDRAKSIESYLVKHGVEPDRVEALGFEADRPIADPKTEEGRAMNRRVELVILK